MTLHLELEYDLEATLAAAAGKRGITIEEFVLALLRSSAPALPRKPKLSDEEFQAALDSLRSDLPEPEHLRTQTFSREFLYADHD